MAKTIKSALAEALEDLEKGDFEKFCHQLLDRREAPRVKRNRVEDKSRLQVTDALVSIFTEEGALTVALEILKQIGCFAEAKELEEATDGKSSKPAPTDGKHFVDKHRAQLIQRVSNIAPILDELQYKEVIDQEQYDKIRALPTSQDKMRELYIGPLQASAAYKDIFYKSLLANEKVLVNGLMEYDGSDWTKLKPGVKSTDAGRKTERSSELEGCQSLTQDCSDWTKLEPEVNSTDADEAPTYSLQSAAGHFECRVSGLRWVCKGKTSFQYQFRSWEGHMERMESRQYMPAGPLMDVTVTAGKLNEVHLPHWICIDDIPDILDTFAVVHIDDCGDVVEKVSEVTPTHVKLTEPIFSPRAVLMKLGVPVKIGCNVLIYQTNTAFLTLHVYLIPRDPGLQQVMKQREVPHGYKAILKPDPEKSLKILDRFTLTADVDGAEICPEDLKLRYPSGKPNFFEVYTENPDGNFRLKLTSKKDLQPVWTCTVRKAEYQSTDQAQAAGSSVGAAAASSQSAEENTVDKHLSAQMQKALTVQSDREKLLGMLEDLKKEELEKFKWFLRDRDVLVELQPIPESRLEKASTCDLVDLMVQTYTEKSVEVTKKVLKKINRNDLVQKLSDSSS